MPFSYYIFLAMILLVAVMLICYLMLRKTNVPVELFIKRLRNENSGEFEEAVNIYESALQEFKKTKLHGNLENKIIEKVKLLNKIIQYRRDSLFIR